MRAKDQHPLLLFGRSCRDFRKVIGDSIRVVEPHKPKPIAGESVDTLIDLYVPRFRQILVEYQKAPAVTRDRMYIETMQQVFGNTTTVLVDLRQGNQLLYLPFDKLIQQAMQDPAAPRAAPPAVPEAPAPADATRSRDTSLRSRDREAR